MERLGECPQIHDGRHEHEGEGNDGDQFYRRHQQQRPKQFLGHAAQATTSALQAQATPMAFCAPSPIKPRRGACDCYNRPPKRMRMPA